VTEKTKPTSAREWPAVDRRNLGWAADWQATVERDKAMLAQSLHDNTGGLLVAAVMDITWAESHLPAAALDVKERLVRARAALDAAIDLNRRMIEDLRPTLLDNFGLIPALKWHFAEVRKSTDIVCEHQLPQPHPDFLPAAAIALYRIAQTLTAVMVRQHARGIKMALTVDSETVTFHMSCDGMLHDFTRSDETTSDALASATGRIKSLGGELDLETRLGGAAVTCRTAARKAIAA
jgi:signal transduction histidine kinase